MSQPDFPDFPPPARTCLLCGAPIASPKVNGRPPRFCSQACRVQQKAGQKRHWQQRNAGGQRQQPIMCRQCGVEFLATTSGPGRLPRFCGDLCRHAGILAREAGHRTRRRRPVTKSETVET